jgi:iron complex transport system substrate-binding protein
MALLTRRRFIAASAVAAMPSIAAAAPLLVTDALGRQIQLKGPAQRALLGVYLEEIAAVAGAEVFSRVAAMSTGTWRDWKNNQWKAYAAKLPLLERIADVGEVSDKTFSVEKAIDARPDVILLAAWQIDMLGAQVERFAAAGIPVAVMDFNAQSLERHGATARLIGRIFGTETRGEAIMAEYSSAIGDVHRRVAMSKMPRRKVYLELGIRGAAEIGNTYDKAMWGPMIEAAGGENIAKGKVGNWGPLTGEAILAAQPDVVFVSGGEWVNNKAALRMGFGMDAGEARAVMRQFAARPGWSALPAVRSGQVHAVSQGMIRSLHDYTQLQFMAKMLHPDAFADVDPEANLGAFYKRWLPVEPKGAFMLGTATSA